MDYTTIVAPPYRWVESYPAAFDKDKLVNMEGETVLDPVAGWDKGDLGIRTGSFTKRGNTEQDKEKMRNTAKFILLACNSHISLVRTLTEVLEYTPDPLSTAEEVTESYRRTARTALAKLAEMEKILHASLSPTEETKRVEKENAYYSLANAPNRRRLEREKSGEY